MAYWEDSKGLLHTNVSGEEMLKLWLSKNPAVTKLAQEQEQDKRTSRGSVETTSGMDATELGLAVELEPYRDMLPPSLCASRTCVPLSHDTAQWG